MTVPVLTGTDRTNTDSTGTNSTDTDSTDTDSTGTASTDSNVTSRLEWEGWFRNDGMSQKLLEWVRNYQNE